MTGCVAAGKSDECLAPWSDRGCFLLLTAALYTVVFIQAGAKVGAQSLGVRKGVYRCALRGLLGAVQDPQMRAALQKAQGPNAVQVGL